MVLLVGIECDTIRVWHNSETILGPDIVLSCVAHYPNELTVVVNFLLLLFSDLSRVRKLRAMERDHAKKHHFVTSDWVTACIEDQTIKNERSYEPKSD